jgi:hypothetical protein
MTAAPYYPHSRGLVALGVLALALSIHLPALASLEAYDTVIDEDAAGGLIPLARLTEPVTLTGTNRKAFDFGVNSGNATIEFILEGDPSANSSAYLAVGANASSNLRYDLYPDTGQLGFTQLGVLDYAFTPGVPSPTRPTHVAYVWNASARTMRLFLNGKLGGTCSGVSSRFAMPSGPGWLGANPQSGEPMVGTIHRVTVYDGMVSEEVLLNHANAFNDVVSPPGILSFTATPDTLFTPASTTLTWLVRNATGIFLNGTDVTPRSNLTVSPLQTTTYTLVATNASATTSARVTVQVNPPPAIQQFTADRNYAAAGETVVLSWNVRFATTLSISPGIGDVTAQTIAGAGSIAVQPERTTPYLLTAGSEFGTDTAQVEIHIVQPADHLVISEFMADDQSTYPDAEGECSGWIEIHNPTGQAVNLGGWSLTDDPTDLTRWAFPSTNLAAGSYLVAFASGQDRAQPGAPLHTSFRLKNEGEYLALVGPGPVVVHAFAPAFPPQRPDISYGILADDVTLAQYMGRPTPGAPNKDTLPAPAPVRFSRSSGTFTEPFALVLTAPEANAEVRFTLDGSAPGLNAGTRYTTPIPITSTTRVRAVAIANGLVSRMEGVSFIKLAPDLAAYTSPLPIMVVENFGAGIIPQKGWNSTGADIKQVPRQAAAWATFEPAGGVCTLTNAAQMCTLAGIRGRGAFSTQWRQKPYSVEAMDEEGAEAEVSPLGLPAHADWVLYFPDPDQNKDPALLFNTFAYELSRNMGHYAVRFRWVEAFVNEDGGDLSLADRRGVYAIIEKVARGKDRLDFQRLSADGATGGWLLNINRMDPEPETGWPAPNGATQPWFFHTPGPDGVLQTEPNRAYSRVPGDDLPQQWNAFINFENPNGFVINPSQRAAIEDWFKRFESVLYRDTLWRDPVQGYRRYLETLDFVDYFVLNVLTRNGDGLLISMFPWKGDDGKLRIGPAWDYNWSSYYVSGGPTGSLLHRSDQLWYPRLFADPDFKQLYIDRWWDFRRGPMSNAAMNAIVDRQAAEITLEKSLLNGIPSTNEWSRRLDQMKSWLNQRADWIDSNYLRPPVFSHNGGDVPDGFALSITGANGVIYVTTDGTDPRAPGGAVAGSARQFTGSLALHSPTQVKARLKNSANWSGLTAAVFSTPQDFSKLVVTEIMYHPPPAEGWSSEDFEFLELKNTGLFTLQLDFLKFTSGIEFAFTNNTLLGPGQFFLLAGNAAAFAARYPGVELNGVYSGKLNNSGETIRLATASDRTVFELTFDDSSPWPLAAAGTGFSLVPRDPGAPANSGNGTDWRASTEPGGSPGRDDPAPPGPECGGSQAPAIVQQPLCLDVVPGATASLSVVVTNTALLPITYRWQCNGQDVPGATWTLDKHAAFLTITNAQPPETSYTVHVANAACPGGLTSAPAVLLFLSDDDGDGLPDAWEAAHGLTSTDPAHGDLDDDGDGLLNWQEYQAGTHPSSASSCLRFNSVQVEPALGAILTFSAAPNKTYSVESTDALATGEWFKLADIAAQSFAHQETVEDPGVRPHRFYRLVTPRQP